MTTDLAKIPAELQYEGLGQYVCEAHLGYHGDPNGIQVLFRFPNGYGASVVRFEYPFAAELREAGLGIGAAGSYGVAQGLFELAVMHFHDDLPSGQLNLHLDYTTTVTNSVMGHLDGQEVSAVLLKIKQLPPKEDCDE